MAEQKKRGSVNDWKPPVGLQYWDKEKAYSGYTLLAPKHFTWTYLLDMEGSVVHAWESRYTPGQTVYLLENGNLLHSSLKSRPEFIGFVGGGAGGGIEEFDWNGDLKWEFWYDSPGHLMHHDVHQLPNGNILLLAEEKKSKEECLAAGFDPDLLKRVPEEYLTPDYLVEIEKTGVRAGKVVWEWHAWDHLIQDFDSSKGNFGLVAAHPELVNPHTPARHLHLFMERTNSIDYKEKYDQILLSNNNEIWIIDHSTSTKEAAGHNGGRRGKGGDLLYRWGNPLSYKTGDSQSQKSFGQHDAQWIPPGYPGEGNIFVFNNGAGRGYSSIDEIVPPVDNKGEYFLIPGCAYQPERAIWNYSSENPTDFFAEITSGAQRLPNGNTLICDGNHGILFEVTPNGQTVWKYVNPVIDSGPVMSGEEIPKDNRGRQRNAVFKIRRYPPEYHGLVGKDLTPRGPLRAKNFTTDNI
jgi:hypothetical protein